MTSGLLLLIGAALLIGGHIWLLFRSNKWTGYEWRIALATTMLGLLVFGIGIIKTDL